MRTLPIILFCLMLAGEAWAGDRYNSLSGHKDYCVTLRTEDGTVVNDDCEPVRVSDGTFTDEGSFFLLRAGSAPGGYTSMTSAETAVSVAFSYVKKAIANPVTDPGFDTGTLPDGYSGQLLTFEITEVAGNGTWTLTPTTATGFTSLVFEAVGDICTLLYVDDSVGWVIISQGSVQRIL